MNNLYRDGRRDILPGMDPRGYSTWLEIDLAAIRNNISCLRALTGSQVMAVVKANGYGHGAVQVARAAVEAGAAWCGVNRIEEALALRQAGLDCPLLVLGYTPPNQVPLVIANQISITVYDPGLVNQYLAYTGAENGLLRVHVKIDTGMGRLGILPEKAVEFIQFLRQQPGLIIEGLYTHFARADEPGIALTHRQLAVFESILDDLESRAMCPPIIHASNSAGSIYFKQSRFNLIRAGMAVYGLHPSPEAPLPVEFHPALSWKARIISIKVFPSGHGISYGSRYITSRVEKIGVIPVGYADGFRRVDHQELLVNGIRIPVVGRVCMDQCMVALDGVPQAGLEDEVVLLGKQGSQVISSEEIARRWGTINYEVVCGLASRLPRIYLNPTGNQSKDCP